MEAEVVATFPEYVAARQRILTTAAYGLTRDWAAAEDLVQEALAKVWPRWERIQDGDPDAYVRTVLVRTYLTGRRRRWRFEQPVARPPDAPASDPYAAADLRDALERVLAELTPRKRALLVLRYYADLSDEQIGVVLNCSPATVRSQAARALRRLRDLTEQPPTSASHK